ncbi:MAG TPA: dienelactone hydrolase family protein [Kribbella sp.]|jgi:putative phosphoribosyl transferase
MPTLEQSLQVPVAGVVLEADVAVPEQARGVVVFAHGSGSSRHSPRNRYVASQLREGGLATVLADLLTHEEEQVDARTAQLRFDIDRLAVRTTALVDWVSEQEATAGLSVGLFGASTGAAAALVAAAARPNVVGAVVSRGGRPDLAGEWLRLVRQPTLLIVGELDVKVIQLNQHARDKLSGPSRLMIVPRASHLFEEPGALEKVAQLASAWFVEHLAGPD